MRPALVARISADLAGPTGRSFSFFDLKDALPLPFGAELFERVHLPDQKSDPRRLHGRINTELPDISYDSELDMVVENDGLVRIAHFFEGVVDEVAGTWDRQLRVVEAQLRKRQAGPVSKLLLGDERMHPDGEDFTFLWTLHGSTTQFVMRRNRPGFVRGLFQVPQGHGFLLANPDAARVRDDVAGILHRAPPDGSARLVIVLRFRYIPR